MRKNKQDYQRAASDLPQASRRVVVEEFSPGRAAGILEGHENVRPVSASRVTQYARDMAAGAWDFNNATIGFDGAGRLVDGQHRLWAVVESGVPMISAVVYGVEGVCNIDRARGRTVGDALRMDGVPNAKSIASAVGTALRITGKRWAPGETPTVQEVRDFVRKRDDLQHWAGQALRARHICPSGCIAGCLIVVSQIDPAGADLLLKTLAGDASPGVTHPFHVLRERLIRAKSERGHLVGKQYLQMFAAAWGAYRAGRTLTRILIRDARKAPVFK